MTYGREQRGVGAPTFAYRLSPQGEALFPKRYEQTLTNLLDALAEKQGREAAVAMFEDHYADLTRRLQAELEGVAPERRLDGGGPGDERGGLHGRGRRGRWAPSAWPSTTAPSARWPSAIPKCAPRRRSSSRRCWPRASSAPPTSSSGCNACEYAITFGAPDAERGEPV